MDYPDGATPLDPDELDGLKFKHVTTREQLDHLEQANIQDGLRWLSNKRNADILNEAFIRELHKKLFGQVWKWAGSFRSTEKNIGIDPRQIAEQLHILLHDVVYWIEHETYPPIEIAARFHHRLVYIHLFPNGNGRHARIIADAVLTNILSTKPIDWAGGHDLQEMNDQRRAYIAALKEADNGEYEQLLKFAGADKEEQ